MFCSHEFWFCLNTHYSLVCYSVKTCPLAYPSTSTFFQPPRKASRLFSESTQLAHSITGLHCFHPPSLHYGLLVTLNSLVFCTCLVGFLHLLFCTCLSFMVSLIWMALLLRLIMFCVLFQILYLSLVIYWKLTTATINLATPKLASWQQCSRNVLFATLTVYVVLYKSTNWINVNVKSVFRNKTQQNDMT